MARVELVGAAWGPRPRVTALSPRPAWVGTPRCSREKAFPPSTSFMPNYPLRCHGITQISIKRRRAGPPVSALYSAVGGASRDGQRGNYICNWRGGAPYFRPGPRRPASEAAPESEEETRKGCCFRGNLEAGVLVLLALWLWLVVRAARIGCVPARRCRRGHRGLAADPLRPAPDRRCGDRPGAVRARARACGCAGEVLAACVGRVGG